jgi:hypothetical protein
MCVCCTQDLLQEELHEDDLESVKRSAQGLGVEVCGWKPVPPSSMYQSGKRHASPLMQAVQHQRDVVALSHHHTLTDSTSYRGGNTMSVTALQ